MDVDAERGEKEPAAPAARGDDAGFARTFALDPGPKIAAEDPSITKNSVYIQPSVLIFQSPGADCVMPMARLSGSQNTLKPYAMPIER